MTAGPSYGLPKKSTRTSENFWCSARVTFWVLLGRIGSMAMGLELAAHGGKNSQRALVVA